MSEPRSGIFLGVGAQGTGANAVYVAGFGSLTNGVKRPVLWVNGGTPIDLAANLGTTRAGTNYAVNSSGVSVGQVQYTVGGSTVLRGFRTTGGTNALATTGDDLPPPDYERIQGVAPPPASSLTKALAVNSSDIAAGSYFVSTGDEFASAWNARPGSSANPAGKYLWVWEAPVPGGASDVESRALGINGSGLLVGLSRSNATVSRAVYSPGVGVAWRDLNDRHFVHGNSGWTLQEARAVNASGTIVGIGLNNGQQRGFILVPRPSGN